MSKLQMKHDSWDHESPSALFPTRGARLDLIALIKAAQKHSAASKRLWTEHCLAQGNGVKDPSKHEPIFLIAFILRLGLAEVVNAPWASGYLVSLGEVSKCYLIPTIKAGQKQSAQWASRWRQFVDRKQKPGDAVYGAPRDPSLHDAGSLMEFFDTFAMKECRDMPLVQPFVTGHGHSLKLEPLSY
jgi:hypothetical protein